MIAGDGKTVVTRVDTTGLDDDGQDISHYHSNNGQDLSHYHPNNGEDLSHYHLDDGQDLSHYHPVLHRLVRPWSYRTIRLDTPLLGRREVEL